MGKSQCRRFAALVKFPASPIYLNLEGRSLPMCRIDAGASCESNLHNLERRHLVIERPFTVAAFDRLDSSFFVRCYLHEGKGKYSLLPTVERGHHKVAVVQLQPRIEAVHPPSPPDELGGSKNRHFEDFSLRIQP